MRQRRRQPKSRIEVGGPSPELGLIVDGGCSGTLVAVGASCSIDDVEFSEGGEALEDVEPALAAAGIQGTQDAEDVQDVGDTGDTGDTEVVEVVGGSRRAVRCQPAK